MFLSLPKVSRFSSGKAPQPLVDPPSLAHRAKKHLASILLIMLRRPCLGQLSTGFLPLVPEVCARQLAPGAAEDGVGLFPPLLEGGADRAVLGFQ